MSFLARIFRRHRDDEQWVLSGRNVVLSHVFATDEEIPLGPASATVTVIRVGDTAPVVSGPATKTGNVYTFTAGVLPQGPYVVTWDGGPGAYDVTGVEVVGSVLFSIADVRADEDLDPVRFPGTHVRVTRDVVEAEFEAITGRSFTRRTARLSVVHDGSGIEILPLFDTTRLNAVVGTDGPLSLTGFELEPDGLLSGFPAAGRYLLDVSYGFDAVPDDVRRAGLIRLRYLLLAQRSAVPDRATSFQPADGGGFYTLATAGRAGFETGIPDVDAVLGRYTLKVLRDVAGL